LVPVELVQQQQQPHYTTFRNHVDTAFKNSGSLKNEYVKGRFESVTVASHCIGWQ